MMDFYLSLAKPKTLKCQEVIKTFFFSQLQMQTHNKYCEFQSKASIAVTKGENMTKATATKGRQALVKSAFCVPG